MSQFKEKNVVSHLVIVNIFSMHFNVVNLSIFKDRQLEFDCHVHISKDARKTFLMTNIEVSTLKLVDHNFVKYHKFFTIALIKSIRLRLIDDAIALNITRLTQVKMQLKNHVEKLWCMINVLKFFDLITSWSWATQHEIIISSKKNVLIFDFEKCLRDCNFHHRSIIVHVREKRRKNFINSTIDVDANITKISISIFMKMIDRNKNQIIAMWLEHFKQLKKSKKIDKYFLFNSFIFNIAIINANDYEKFFNNIKKILITKKQLKKRIFQKFHEYLNRWDSKKIDKMFSHKNWDHKIDFQSNFKTFAKKVYKLFKDQISIVKKYVNDMLDKNFIRFNIFDFVAFVLIVKKFEKELRVCIDYKALNALTMKNRNASFLIREILSRLCATK